MIQLGNHGAHAVVAQSAGVIGRGDKAAAECVHAHERRGFARVAEIVDVLAARHRRAGSRLDGDKTRVRLAVELVRHKRRDKSAEVAAAACAADYDVGTNVVLVHCGLAFESDYRLVEKNVVEHRAQNVAALVAVQRDLDSFGNSAAQRAARARVFGEDFPAHFGGVRRRGYHVRAVGFHHGFAVGLLLTADFDHVHVEVEPVKRASHRQRRAPLPSARFGGDRSQALGFGVVSLRDGGIELVRARSVVALELVVDFGRRVQHLF